LNADTKFRYPIAFVGDKREVFIENGEVFFDVVENKKKPFIVNFNHHQVTVLGTQFNVKSYEENNADLVTLAQGSIQIDNSSVKLVPNQQAVIDRSNSRIKINTVDAHIFSAWKNKHFLYKQDKLENIMNDLSRFYNIKVFYRNEKIKEEMFSLRLSQEDSFETILENFELTGKVEFEINKNNIIIQ
jgi:ferric-dicitrate binding protein FerR (iron transport regulator)